MEQISLSTYWYYDSEWIAKNIFGWWSWWIKRWASSFAALIFFSHGHGLAEHSGEGGEGEGGAEFAAMKYIHFQRFSCHTNHDRTESELELVCI